MTPTPPPDDAQQPEQTNKSNTNEPLIRVHPDAQMAPGANERCPVCGQPYAQGSIPADTNRQETRVVLADEPAQEPASQQKVIRCAQCGTYSVGRADTSPTNPEAEQ
ncbi:MAG TPA: hypothetical protein VH540_10260 [Ktedonobacterales bacterium]|jgi:hypothetical protein